MKQFYLERTSISNTSQKRNILVADVTEANKSKAVNQKLWIGKCIGKVFEYDSYYIIIIQ